MEKGNNKPFNIHWLTRTALLLAVTLAFQMLGFPQMVTGPAVNAMLLISATYAGPTGGIIIGILTPLIAFLRGTLAPALAPMIPFIMLGNAVYVLIWAFCRVLIKNVYAASVTGIVAGSAIKFFILASAVSLLVTLPLAISHAMQLPQLYTALAGGIIALAINKALAAAFKKSGKK
jgi:hypothetical protein